MTPEELRRSVDTIVVVMLENRSFDHMLGYLRLPNIPKLGGRDEVDGLRSLDDPQYANASGSGEAVRPFLVDDDAPLPGDLPHERAFVAQQVAFAPGDGFAMNGFVRAYEAFTGARVVRDPPPMRVMTPPFLPVTSFFAEEFTVCDQWHAPLPTSTQPNRLMAVSGYTVVDTTHRGLLPDQDTVFDWCERHGVRWRVYSAGLSFFTLMPKMWPHLVNPRRFRTLSSLSRDVQFEEDATFPQVIFVEPDYDDSPVHLGGHASDDHPPLPLAFGELFLKTVYDAVTSSARRWGRTVMVVTYDEHGGFFDHVAPLAVPFAPPPDAHFTEAFSSTGVRVPAFVLSPYTQRRSVASLALDHTSILQMIADRFDPSGAGYSASVEARRTAASPIGSVTATLSAQPRAETPRSPPVSLSTTVLLSDLREPLTDAQKAFAGALEAFAKDQGHAALEKYPQVAHWLANR
jgi:phospholipase C